MNEADTDIFLHVLTEDTQRIDWSRDQLDEAICFNSLVTGPTVMAEPARHSSDTVLTRDPRRFRTYFPDLAIIAPEEDDE